MSLVRDYLNSRLFFNKIVSRKEAELLVTRLVCVLLRSSMDRIKAR